MRDVEMQIFDMNFFFVGQLHKDVPIEEHPGNLTIFYHDTLTATAYQLIFNNFV